MSKTGASFFNEEHAGQGSQFGLAVRRVLHEEKTPYQHIAIYETSTFGNLMVIDGCTMLTTRDNFLYHEMMTHPALFTHANPKKVVIIGGGDCGSLQEVLKHPSVQEAWQVEIDERVTRLAEQYFPELCTANNDPRAHFYFGDGIQWIKDAPKESIDLIIIDSTDPVGPAEGLFQAPFYQDCWHALKPGGLVVQQSESPFYHLELIKSIHQTLKQVGFSATQTLHFPQPIYPSGWWSATMGCKGGSFPAFRAKEVEAKTFKTRYYNANIHQAALTLPEFVKTALER